MPLGMQYIIDIHDITINHVTECRYLVEALMHLCLYAGASILITKPIIMFTYALLVIPRKITIKRTKIYDA